jgi:hypothetical protein
MRMESVVVVVAMLAVGCGGAAMEEAQPRSGVLSPSQQSAAGSWISAPKEVLAPAPVRTLSQRGTILIGEPAPPPPPSRPRAGGRVEVSFHRADLENALRFLADSGRFNLVVESGLSGVVTASLRGVDAYEALVMISQANGADVRYERGIVMVRRATATR